jgi:CRISPR-associated endonuclease/helicase Cas3
MKIKIRKVIIYAKSKPIETLKEHTNGLLSNIKLFRKTEGKKILARVPKEYRNSFWDILTLCAKYHDLGKISIGFQNNIRKALGETTIKDNLKLEVLHNYLSPAFFTKQVLARYSPEVQRIIVQAVFYHHERGIEPDFVSIEKIIKYDLEKRKNYAKCLIDCIPDKLWDGYADLVFPRIENPEKTLKSVGDRQKTTEELIQEKKTMDLYKLFILIKGELHKADHTASGHVDMEIIDHSMSKKTLKFLNKFPEGPRALQVYAKKHRRKSVVIVASTGLGKTEASFLWGGEEKLFYFLPLRVATNAIFDRAREQKGINYQHAGLLHSSSAEHLDANGLEDVYSRYQNSRQLIDPVAFSTIDQLFIYPFYYGGYEKVLATLAYSKIVIDEIQSYDPKIAAVVLYGLKELQAMGGRFMLMTATLPKFYLDMLKKWGVKFSYGEFLSPLKRHKLQMFPKDIIGDVKDIAEEGKRKKVLVIANTIAKANAISAELKTYNCKAKLFHSLFTGEDRRKLEEEVKTFSDSATKVGVWVTTQIVEASLDIDFDVLYTEFSSPDSLFQRMGRTYRDRSYRGKGPNIKVYTENCSGIEIIYDKSIFDLSKEVMLDFVGQPSYITEERKQAIVNKIYSEAMLKGTTYYKTFNEALEVLQNLQAYSVSKSEAHNLFRNINSYQTIPEETFLQFKDQIKASVKTLMEASPTKNQKMEARRYLSDKSVNVPAYRVGKNGVKIEAVEDTDGNIYRINCLYDKDLGLNFHALYKGKPL